MTFKKKPAKNVVFFVKFILALLQNFFIFGILQDFNSTIHYSTLINGQNNEI